MRMHPFAQDRAGHRHDRRLHDTRISEQDVFDLGGEDLVSAPVDHVLDPVNHADETLIVANADIA